MNARRSTFNIKSSLRKNHARKSIKQLAWSRHQRLSVSLGLFLVVVTLFSAIQIIIIPPVQGEAVSGTVTVGVNPSGIAFDTSTNIVYVSNYGINGTFPSTVTVLNGTNNGLIGTITAGVNPAGIAVDSLTHKAYVANYNSSNVSVITGTGNSTTTVPVGMHPAGVAVNAATDRIYVANGGSGTVSVIDGTTNTVVSTISVGRSPVSIATVPSTNRVYVANSLDGTVSVIDGHTNSLIRTLGVGNDPGSIAADNSTNLIYVVNSNSSSGMITVIDGTSNTVAYTIPVGAYPTGIDLNALTNKIYVANSADGTVSVVDGFSKTEVNTVSLAFGSVPGAVGVNPVTNEVYVVNGGGRRTLSVISGSPTATGISCNPSTVQLNISTICVATVTDLSGAGATPPTGLVYFSTSAPGSFNSTICSLRGSGNTATCNVSYAPAAVGTGSHTLYATFSGDTKHMSSSGNGAITVTSSSLGGRLLPQDRSALFASLVLPVSAVLVPTSAIILAVRIRKSRKCICLSYL